MVAQKTLILALLATTLSGCAKMMFWKDDEPVKPDAAATASEPATPGGPVATKPTLQDEQQLKVAKLWARVDELEEEQFRQKERIRVLEKGITLGLVPEELKSPKVVKAPPKLEPKVEAKVEAKGDAKDLLPPDGKAPPVDAKKGELPALSKEDAEKYQTMLASAHDQYRSGRYGRAIVEYSEIGKLFGDKIEGGMHQYWISKSWANLKEYNTARQSLVEFLKDHASSPWAPRAKLELARVEWQLGLQETALNRFREIIQEHPYEDAAEMAKMELENLDKKL